MFSALSLGKFQDKTVIITGASSGIGAATAVEFAKEGANLVLSGRDECKLIEVKETCFDNGLDYSQINTVIGDITDIEIQQQLLDAALNNFGCLHVLVNNAGKTQSIPILELKMEDYERVQNVNLRAAVSLSLVALPHLIRTKGNIVNVSSVASTRPVTNSLPYCISKAGLDMLTKCLAFELGPQGVRVNSVNPGAVSTKIDHDVNPDSEVSGVSKERMKKFMEVQCLGRIGDVKEIAEAILFLASEQSSFITGQNIGVCGGSSIPGIVLNT